MPGLSSKRWSSHSRQLLCEDGSRPVALANDCESNEISGLFDEQVDDIFRHIDSQLEHLEQGEGCNPEPEKVVR